MQHQPAPGAGSGSGHGAGAGAGGQPAPRAGRGLVVGGAVTMGVSLLIGILAVVGIVRGVGAGVEAFGADPLTAPVAATVELTGQSNTLYLTEDDAGTAVEDAVLDSLEIVGPSGEQVEVRPVRFDETLTLASVEYVAVARLAVERSGEHRVVADAPAGTTILITRSVGSVLGGVLGGFLAGLPLAGLLFVVGLVLLVVGLVRRGRRPAAAQAPARSPASTAPPVSAPPGWYPDPYQPGRQRYFDGSRWTDHAG